MFSKRKAGLLVFVAAAVTLGGGVFVYETPASTNVTITPWSDYLSERAVDSAGIENDLDGNAASLFASDRVL